MFWIGLIVGIVVTVAIACAVIVVSFKIAGVTKDEFVNAHGVVTTALANRESEMVVVHNDEVVASCVFEEK